MNKWSAIIVVVFALLLIGVIAFLARPADVDWAHGFHADQKEPYDTYIFQELIKSNAGEDGFVDVRDSLHSALAAESDSGSNYLFVGNQFHGDDKDVAALLDFVARGNQAFLIANYPGQLLSEVCALDEQSNWEYTEDGSYLLREGELVNTVTDTLLVAYTLDKNEAEHQSKIQCFIDYEPVMHPWNFFNSGIRAKSDGDLRIIGKYDGDFANVLEVRWGSGTLYFHCTPLAFTKWAMKKKSGMGYCRALLSHMNDGKVYWDSENTIMDMMVQQRDQVDSSVTARPGPLEYILSQPALSAAWYFSLLMVLLYLVFAGRRRQRAVRTIRTPSNTSIEFTEVVSQLFLKQKDHRKLVHMKMEMWKSQARERYRIRWQEHSVELDQAELNLWSLRSGVPAATIAQIIEAYQAMHPHNAVETKDMLRLHSLLETYYQNCK